VYKRLNGQNGNLALLHSLCLPASLMSDIDAYTTEFVEVFGLSFPCPELYTLANSLAETIMPARYASQQLTPAVAGSAHQQHVRCAAQDNPIQEHLDNSKHWCCRSNPRPLIFRLFFRPLAGFSHATQDLHTWLCARGAQCHRHNCHVNTMPVPRRTYSTGYVSYTWVLSDPVISASLETSPRFCLFPPPSSCF
jgi:hypothetical protein